MKIKYTKYFEHFVKNKVQKKVQKNDIDNKINYPETALPDNKNKLNDTLLESNLPIKLND